MAPTMATQASFTSSSEPKASESRYDSELRNTAAKWSKLSESERSTIQADPVGKLQQLNPAENSIGYLAILEMALQSDVSPSVDRLLCLNLVLEFLLKFDPIQMRYVGAQLVALLNLVATGNLFPPRVAVELLATAILKIDPTGSTFTSTHLAMLKLAYDTDCLEPALPIIDRDIMSFPNMSAMNEPRPLCDRTLPPSAYISSSTGLTKPMKPATILEYNFLCGLAYMSRRDWPKAQAALGRAVTHPTKEKATSKIMIDAYKKWVLVGLLNEGKSPSLASYISGPTKNAFNNLAEPYNQVAKMFDTSHAAQLKIDIEKHSSLWQEDGNVALIAEVRSAYQKWQIIKLRRIYRQISISQIRQRTMSAELGAELDDDAGVARLVQSMIDSGMLEGELSSSDGGAQISLAFNLVHNTPPTTEEEFAGSLARSQQNIKSLSMQYRQANERLSGSKEYVKHVLREQKRQEKEGLDPGLGFDDQVEDEDLMTGILTHE